MIAPNWNADVDVVVIGGGPAGATVATLLAQQGHRVRLLEREGGPRFHIGESLIPASFGTFERLGILDWLRSSDFPRKYSVQFYTHEGKASRPFYFFDTNPHESAVSWQVWRKDFDAKLLENAQQHGCEVIYHAHVTDVLFDEPEREDGGRAVGVKARLADGTTVEIPAKAVVDASGQSSIIANRLKLRVPNPALRQASVWTYFRNAKRDAGIDGGATLILNTKDKHGWFWFIPLPDGITSVGAVSSLDYLMGRKQPAEEVFAAMVAECEPMKERLADAERVEPFRVTKDFSYMTKRAAGDGWCLVGDAFGFLDPVYSSGVLLALKSGEFAADAIHDGLTDGDLSAERLGRWEATHRKGIDNFRRLVNAFYSYEFSFGRFIRQHPEYASNLVDLLVGDVFKPGVDEIFQAMGDWQPYDGQPPARELAAASAGPA